ncbi:MAG: HlyD family secretion protein [Clostridiaceae bacterium]
MKKLFAYIIAIAFIAAGCSSDSGSVTLKGVIQNNIISSNSTVSGKITEMKVQQGQKVKKGDVIAIIDSVNPKYNVDQLQAVVNMKKAKLEELQAGTRTEQITQAREALDTAQKTYDYQSNQYAITLKLYESGAASKAELDSVRLKADTASNQLSTAQSQLELLSSGATKQAIDFARADLAQAEAQLNQAKNNLSNYSITALESGIVISKNFELGDMVTAGSNIADVAMDDSLYVLCYVPVKYLDKIYYDQELQVKTSLGTQTGKIIFIALDSEYTPKDMQTKSESEKQAVKVKVSVKDSSGRLKQGVDASVIIPVK